MKFTAIIPASGKGLRMGSNTPKQFMPLDGKPVLYYSLRAFEMSPVDEVILVTSPESIEFVKNNIVTKYGFKKVSKIVPGGAERYLSVYEGLMAADDADYVLIHDAARPLLDLSLITSCMNAVEKYDACVPFVPVADTIKIRTDNDFAETTPDRSTLCAIQTPQCFKRSLLLDGYRSLKGNEGDCSKITDDASVIELGLHKPVKLIPGNPRNRKLTTPEDFIFAEALLADCE